MTAGAPGSFDKDIPATLAALNALTLTGDTGARWTTGDYVDLADGSDAFWNGTAFEAGRATNPSTSVTAGAPGSFDKDIPEDLAVLNTLTLTGDTGVRWATGDYVGLADGSEAFWNGLTFELGRATNPSTFVTAGAPGSFDQDIRQASPSLTLWGSAPGLSGLSGSTSFWATAPKPIGTRPCSSRAARAGCGPCRPR